MVVIPPQALQEFLDLTDRHVNAISAGPIKTLAAAGIQDFRLLLDHAESRSALRRNVSIDEVGNAAAFLCSDQARAITGVMHPRRNARMREREERESVRARERELARSRERGIARVRELEIAGAREHESA